MFIACCNRKLSFEVGCCACLELYVHISAQLCRNAGLYALTACVEFAVSCFAVVEIIIIYLFYICKVRSRLENSLYFRLGIVCFCVEMFEQNTVVVHVRTSDRNKCGCAGLICSVDIASALVDDTFALTAYFAVALYSYTAV